MTPWLLDDGPFGLLAQVYDPTWAWPANTLHVVHDVAKAAKLDQSGRRQKLLTMGAPNLSVRVHRPTAYSAASTYFLKYLRPRAADARKNMGEDVAIALAATDEPSLVFVLRDGGAALVALAELGPGRVATPFECWHELHAAGLLTLAQRDDLHTRTHKGTALPGVPLRFR
jgi:hypothetical protein